MTKVLKWVKFIKWCFLLVVNVVALGKINAVCCCWHDQCVDLCICTPELVSRKAACSKFGSGSLDHHLHTIQALFFVHVVVRLRVDFSMWYMSLTIGYLISFYSVWELWQNCYHHGRHSMGVHYHLLRAPLTLTPPYIWIFSSTSSRFVTHSCLTLLQVTKQTSCVSVLESRSCCHRSMALEKKVLLNPLSWLENCQLCLRSSSSSKLWRMPENLMTCWQNCRYQ